MATRTEVIQRHLEKMSSKARTNLALLATPRLVHPYIKHIPHPTQQVFLSLNSHREVLFGGAAGGGKSDALLMAALQYVDVPGYAALLLRKTWPDLVLPGAIMDRARQWLEDTPARPKDGGRVWLFPSGARIQFGYLQHDAQKFRYQSAEFQFIGFDELTQWREEATYDYLFSRLRKPAIACLNCGKTLFRYRIANGTTRYNHTNRLTRCTGIFADPKTLAQYPEASDGTSVFDVPLRMRSATNPGGVGNGWVKTRFIDKKTRREKALFIPSKLIDNPSIDRDVYRESLSYLNDVDRARLEDGDWDVTEAGEYFYRADFEFIDSIPGNIAQFVRFWDMAASERKGADWTVGTLVGLTDNGTIAICDVVRVQKHPNITEKILFNTAVADGLDVSIRSEMEPGSSGMTVVDHYRRNVFPGFNYDGIRATGSKEGRATAYSSYVKGKKVQVVKAKWNREWLNEHEQFPNGAHDDQVDSAASGFNFLMFGRRARLIA